MSSVADMFDVQKAPQGQIVKLPEEYFCLARKDAPFSSREPLSYLMSRGISSADIKYYKIGYCDAGKYKRRIIIPSFDDHGNCNYFSARTYGADWLKYKNPPASKNIIPFELFINFNSPLILCEGVFDAMTIKRNAIPLLGKHIQQNLMKKIVGSKVKKIYIALDSDAIKDSLKFCEQFMNEGKEVYLVELKQQDPNEMGFDKITKLIQNTEPISYSSLLEKKINSI